MSELKADNTFVFGEECLAYKKSEADKVIAEKDKEIRRLKRALYKACANWAMNARMVEIEAEPWGENHESRLWAGVYDKCLKKAAEFGG